MGFFSPKNTPENAVKAQIDAKLAFINDKYTEIGRFVKLRMADKIEEPEVKNLIAQIDATLEELKNLNEQLLTIRGMKLCSGCGHEIPVNMAFCPNCGTKQPEMAQPVYGNPAQQNVQTAAPIPEPVVTQTAAPIPQPETAPQPAPMPQPAPVIAEAPVQEPANSSFVFCSQCGHKEPAGVKFCSECGMKL